MKEYVAAKRKHFAGRFNRIPLNRLILVSVLLSVALLAASCSAATPAASPDASPVQTSAAVAKASPVNITAAEAQNLLDTDPTAQLVDVRTPEEYASGHIPGATLLPVSEITDRKDELPSDLETPIIVYCRSGARSAQAAQELVSLGYANVYDLGGIVNWTGELVR
jgi:rhodanese-related sulfurtransferase